LTFSLAFYLFCAHEIKIPGFFDRLAGWDIFICLFEKGQQKGN
jgi:hypothetical protein